MQPGRASRSGDGRMQRICGGAPFRPASARVVATHVTAVRSVCPRPATVAALLLAALAGGCGSDDDPKTIDGSFGDDGKELASQVESAAQQETGDSITVRCPKRVKLSDDEHVDCRAEVGGNTRKVRVTRQDGVYRWRLYDFLDPERVERDIERGFKQRLGRRVSADCERVPIKRDLVSFCTASTAQREYRIQVRQTDDVGGIRWDVK